MVVYLTTMKIKKSHLQKTNNDSRENVTLCRPRGRSCVASALTPGHRRVSGSGPAHRTWLKVVSLGYNTDHLPLCSWFSCFPRWQVGGGYSISTRHSPVPFRVTSPNKDLGTKAMQHLRHATVPAGTLQVLLQGLAQ